MRQDVHSPKRFKPDDYTAVGYLDNHPPPPPVFFTGADTEEILRWWKAERDEWEAGILAVFPSWRTGGEDHRSVHQCNHCGAHIRYVVVVEHAPTGKLLAFGEICASERIGIPIEEFQMRALRTKANLARKEFKRKIERVRWEAERKAKAEEDLKAFETENPTIVQRLRAYEGANSFLLDLREKMTTWGELSGKQIVAAEKALNREAEEASGPPEIMPPEGRQEIEGEIISAKWRESDYGSALKLTVKVTAAAGRYRLWGTCPAALLDRMIELCDRHGYGGNNQGAADNLVGCRVAFTAAICPKEDGFGFYSRPTKAAIIEHGIDTTRDLYGDPIKEVA